MRKQIEKTVQMHDEMVLIYNAEDRNSANLFSIKMTDEYAYASSIYRFHAQND